MREELNRYIILSNCYKNIWLQSTEKWSWNGWLKELKFNDFDKCVHDITNTPITKEQTSFRSYNHKIYTVTSNKVVMWNANPTYPRGTNIPFITYYDGKVRIKEN